MEQGFIKLFRIFKEWEWYDKSEMVHLFIHLLLTANHKPKQWRGLSIGRGQVVTGRLRLAKTLNFSEQTLRSCLNRLKSTNEVTIKSTNKYSIITLCNYNRYQDTKNEINQLTNHLTNQQSTNNQPATNQQLTTNKNDKKEKNDKNDKNNNIPDWIQSFEKYKKDALEAKSKLLADDKYILERKKYHTGLNIRTSIEKAFNDYWLTEEAWTLKKKSKVKTINWKQTISNALSFKSNQVWLPRDEQEAEKEGIKYANA